MKITLEKSYALIASCGIGAYHKILADGEEVGTCFISENDSGCAYLGIGIYEGHREKGYGKKVVNIVKGAHTEVVCDVAQSNKASTALFEGCGFKITHISEPKLANNYFPGSGFIDVVNRYVWRKESNQ